MNIMENLLKRHKTNNNINVTHYIAVKLTCNKIDITVIWYQKIHHVLLCCGVGAK